MVDARCKRLLGGVPVGSSMVAIAWLLMVANSLGSASAQRFSEERLVLPEPSLAEEVTETMVCGWVRAYLRQASHTHRSVFRTLVDNNMGEVASRSGDDSVLKSLVKVDLYPFLVSSPVVVVCFALSSLAAQKHLYQGPGIASADEADRGRR